jgi:hypothetical protein
VGRPASPAQKKRKEKIMKAFHGKKTIKAKYLSRIRAHAAADEIQKGFYWQRGRGCAVGCTVHGDDHAAYETELGIPVWLALLEDWIFEALPMGKAKRWPERFLSAIAVGQDLEAIKKPFLAFVVADAKESARLAEARAASTAARTTARAAARTAAAKAAAWAARAAAEADAAARAADAVWEAAEAAAAAGRAAPRAAAALATWEARAAWPAAWEAAWARFAEKLISLIENSPDTKEEKKS